MQVSGNCSMPPPVPCAHFPALAVVLSGAVPRTSFRDADSHRIQTSVRKFRIRPAVISSAIERNGSNETEIVESRWTWRPEAACPSRGASRRERVDQRLCGSPRRGSRLHPATTRAGVSIPPPGQDRFWMRSKSAPPRSRHAGAGYFLMMRLADVKGAYPAERAAALSGVPRSTVHYWAKNGILVPSVSPTKVKLWSYADLMGLRTIHWLRQRKITTEGWDVPRTAMPAVRKALKML